MTARRPLPAVHVARHTVAARHGRVWLHQQGDGDGDGDGDLTPAEARALAAALNAAAVRAERRRDPMTGSNLSGRRLARAPRTQYRPDA